MKKRFSFIVVFTLFVLFMSAVVRADSILDFLQLAEAKDDTFGYSSDDRLIIKDVTNSYIDVESPIVKNWSRDVTAYLFNVSTARANAAPVAYWCIYDLNDVAVNWNKFSVSLSLRTDSIGRNETYYIYAIPVDWLSIIDGINGLCTSNEAKEFLDSWVLWRESITNWEDPCFVVDGSIYWEWSYCENHNSGNGWNNNVGIYAIRNVSHTYNGKNITLTWESLGADVNVEVFLWYENDNTFKKIWDVNSERKTFTFKAVHNGDHIVKLRPADNYQSIDYTAHYLETQNPQVEPVTTTTTPVKPVVVWPKENIMLIIFGTLILYIVYRIARRKA